MSIRTVRNAAGGVAEPDRTIRGASGYLVFLVGEGLILSGAAMNLVASAPSFTAGVLPFFAYPFLAATLSGWARVHCKHGAADDRRASS